MTQLHSFGMTKKYRMAGIDCFLLQQDLPSIAEPMEGFVQLNHFSPYNPDAKHAAYNARFKRSSAPTPTSRPAPTTPSSSGAAAVEKAKSFDPDKVAEAHEGMCVDNTHVGRQCIRKEDHQVIMDMHLYQVKGGKNLPIARIAGSDSIGEAMVGRPRRGVHLGAQEKVDTRSFGLRRRGPLPQLLHGSSSGRAGAAGAGPHVIFGLLGVMNFAHASSTCWAPTRASR